MKSVQIVNPVNNKRLDVNLLNLKLPRHVVSDESKAAVQFVQFASDELNQIKQSPDKDFKLEYSDTEEKPKEDLFNTAKTEQNITSDGWSGRETLQFIKILQKFKIKFRDPNFGSATWSSISKELSSKKIRKSPEECCKKWNDLLQTHKIVREKSDPRWKYFKEFSMVLNGDSDISDSELLEDDRVDENIISRSNFRKNPAVRDFWSKFETLKFLDLYQKYKSERKKYSDGHFWSLISNELSKEGVMKSWEKCSVKWKNLIRTYRKNLSRDNKAHRKFLYFKELDEILDNIPMNAQVEKMSENEFNSCSEDENIIGNDDADFDHPDRLSKDATTKESQIAFWNTEETLAFLEIYKKHKQMFLLSSTSTPVWKLISEELACKGIDRSIEKCRTKWKNLRRGYKTHLKMLAKRNDSAFAFAKEMEEILYDSKQIYIMKDDLEDSEYANETFEEIIIETTQQDECDDNISWSSNETLMLIETVGKHKNSFNEHGESSLAWEQISSDLSLQNIYKTPDSCKMRWKALLSVYMSVKNKPERTDFKYFDEIHNIFQEEVGFVEKKEARHKKNCDCYARGLEAKSKRHQERMAMMKRKLDLEQKKLLAFEQYLNYLKGDKGGDGVQESFQM